MTCNSSVKDFLARITPPCTDVTRFVSESMDRTLPVLTRIKLRLHLMICEGCAQYRQQLLNIRRALQRPASPSQDQRQDSPPLSPATQARLKEAFRARHD
jgi:hypothetical protein